MALKCIPLPSKRRGGEGEEEKERGANDRQGEREEGERRARPGNRLAPAGIVCAARAPSPAPHCPATHPPPKPGRPPAPLSTSTPPKKRAALQDVLSGRRAENRAGPRHPTPTPPTPPRGASC